MKKEPGIHFFPFQQISPPSSKQSAETKSKTRKTKTQKNYKIKQNMIATGKIYFNTLKVESNNFFILKIKQANIAVLLKW